MISAGILRNRPYAGFTFPTDLSTARPAALQQEPLRYRNRLK
jgi:hypothetical protein